MSKKYRFRKVYFICSDNQLFKHNYEFINCYRRADYAVMIYKQKQNHLNDESNKWYQHSSEIEHLKTEGFYLVHESLFEEILEMWCKQEIKE